MKSNPVRILFAFACLFLLSAANGWAVTYTWIGTAGASWATAANWSPTRTTPATSDVLQFTNGSSASATAVPTQTIGQLIISNNTAVTLTSASGTLTLSIGSGIAGTDLLVESGSSLTLLNGGTAFTVNYAGTGTTGSIDGNLTVGSGVTWNVTTGTSPTTTVSGTVANTNAITASAATLTFASGGTYQHKFTTAAGTIPTATWNANSTCEIIGYTSNTSTPSGLNQTFGHFTWNCAGQIGTINLGGALTTIAGNFTVVSTGSGSFQGKANNNSGYTFTIGGDFIIQGGSYTFSPGNNGNPTFILNIGGDYNQTGGTFNHVTGNPLTVNFTGAGKTFTQSAGTFTTSGMNFAVDSGASLTLSSDFSSVSASRNFTVSSGGILYCGTQVVFGSGSFIVASGGKLGIGSTDGITTAGNATGNIQTTTRTFNAGGTYVYNGTSAQNTGNALPATLTGGVTNENSAGLTLNASRTITSPGIFTVADGAVQTMGTTINITGNGTFTLASGGTLEIASTAGITSSGATGNIQTSTRNYSTNANYTYIGTAAQAAGNGLPTRIFSLTNNNTAGAVTLSSAITNVSSVNLAGGAQLSLPAGTTSTATNFNVAGVSKVAGTWGSTSSTATYQNNSYFAATTGLLNVSDGGTATAITISSSSNPAGYLDSLTFTASSLPTDATGNVIFKTNGTALSASAVSSGSATSAATTLLPRGTNTVTAEYAGDGSYFGSTNSLFQVVTNHPPVAGTAHYSRPANVALKFPISELLTNVTDADLDTITLTSVSSSTPGVTVQTNSTQVLYASTNNAGDSFSYTVSDGHGGSATGSVVITVEGTFAGQNATITVTNSTVTLTFFGLPGLSYITQRSTNLFDTSENISTNTAPASVMFQVIDSNAPAGSASYRLSTP